MKQFGIISENPKKAKKEQIKAIGLNNNCNNGPISGFLINLNKAYLIPSFSDFPDYKLQEIKKTNPKAIGLLALEANVRNSRKSGNTDGIYGNQIFRLRRGSIDNEPVVYGATMLAPQSSKVLYTYFPVLEGENKFKLMYCNFSKNPAVIELDFGSTDSKTFNGIYSINNGFTSLN